MGFQDRKTACDTIDGLICALSKQPTGGCRFSVGKAHGCLSILSRVPKKRCLVRASRVAHVAVVVERWLLCPRIRGLCWVRLRCVAYNRKPDTLIRWIALVASNWQSTTKRGCSPTRLDLKKRCSACNVLSWSCWQTPRRYRLSHAVPRVVPFRLAWDRS